MLSAARRVRPDGDNPGVALRVLPDSSGARAGALLVAVCRQQGAVAATLTRCRSMNGKLCLMGGSVSLEQVLFHAVEWGSLFMFSRSIVR